MDILGWTAMQSAPLEVKHVPQTWTIGAPKVQPDRARKSRSTVSEQEFILYNKKDGCKHFPKTGKRGAPQAFAYILFNILENEGGAIVSWADDGSCFNINDAATFTTVVLEKYFRHQNLASFQRQLNLYGFKKVKRGTHKGYYEHPYFLRGRHDLLTHIKRPRQNCGEEEEEPPPLPPKKRPQAEREREEPEDLDGQRRRSVRMSRREDDRDGGEGAEEAHVDFSLSSTMAAAEVVASLNHTKYGGQLSSMYGDIYPDRASASMAAAAPMATGHYTRGARLMHHHF